MKMRQKTKKHKCPECGTEIRWQGNRYRPFCSSRCKQIDLGKWLGEEYSLPVNNDVEILIEQQSGQEALH